VCSKENLVARIMDTEYVKNVLSVLDKVDEQKVRAMFANYRIDGESFEDAFELQQYNLQ